MTKKLILPSGKPFVLCPTAPKLFFRYIQPAALPEVGRVATALLLAETTLKLDQKMTRKDLVHQIELRGFTNHLLNPKK